MGRVRLPHIYRFYLSLTASPCRPGRVRVRARSRAVPRAMCWARGGRRGRGERGLTRRGKKARSKWDMPRWPRNGTVTSGRGTTADTSFRFASPPSESYGRRSRIRARSRDYVNSWFLYSSLFANVVFAKRWRWPRNEARWKIRGASTTGVVGGFVKRIAMCGVLTVTRSRRGMNLRNWTVHWDTRCARNVKLSWGKVRRIEVNGILRCK